MLKLRNLHSPTCTLVIGLVLSTAPLHAADPSGQQPRRQAPAVSVPPPAAQPATAATQPAKPRPIPFHGTLSTFSPSLKTITVGKRVFQLTSETKIYKGDNKTPGSFSDARVGAPVTGSYFKYPDGKFIAKSIFFKPMPGLAVAAATNQPASGVQPPGSLKMQKQ